MIKPGNQFPHCRIVVARERKWRPWQFSLRTIFVVMTIACIALAVQARIQQRRRFFSSLVDKFIQAIDKHNYAEAQFIARQANAVFPDDAVAMHMLEKSKFAQEVASGNTDQMMTGGFVCGQVDESNFRPFGDAKRWAEISTLRLARAKAAEWGPPANLGRSFGMELAVLVVCVSGSVISRLSRSKAICWRTY